MEATTTDDIRVAVLESVTPDGQPLDPALLPEADRAHRCYEMSFRKLLHDNDPKAVLVHGFPRSTHGDANGRRIGHAWVERWDTIPVPPALRAAGFPEFLPMCKVWDPMMAEWVLMEVYYVVGQIEPEDCVYLTADEAIEMSLERATVGPWFPVLAHLDDAPMYHDEDDNPCEDDEEDPMLTSTIPAVSRDPKVAEALRNYTGCVDTTALKPGEPGRFEGGGFVVESPVYRRLENSTIYVWTLRVPGVVIDGREPADADAVSKQFATRLAEPEDAQRLVEQFVAVYGVQVVTA